MFKVNDLEDFMAEVRAIDPSLKSLKLNSVEIDKGTRTVKYNFISDQIIGWETKNDVKKYVTENCSATELNVVVNVRKIVSNPDLINVEIYNYLKDNYPSVSIFLKDTDIRSTVVGGVVKYVLRLTEDGDAYVKNGGVMRKLNEHLGKNFCSDFVGSTEIKEREDLPDISSEEIYESELSKIQHRTIKVKDVVVIDDESVGDVAEYIEDALNGDVTVCGRVTEISEKETKNGKPFFIIHIDDTTGRTSGVYFSKKSTLPKIRDVKVGDAIITRGNIGDYNGRRSFTMNKINRCTFPDDFVKKDKFKKTAPREYRLVYPSPATTIKAESVFDVKRSLPKELTDETYVVFDLETTGIDLMNNGITEIGAVKIVGGKICEQFTTLVKPDYPITDEIVKLTGITDALVKDAPKIGSVIPDFMKFIEGAVLVAHNAEFDTKFMKRFAGVEEYEIKNKVMDTMELAREQLPGLKRADLHTVADHFGIIFHHHRALSDAYATAEAFIELMCLKYPDRI